MECDKIRDWLMTDYLDQELGSKKSSEVEKHLRECLDCREFSEAIWQQAVEPFKKVKPMTPDPAMWQRIHQTLESESRPLAWLAGLVEGANVFLRMLRPVIQGAFAAALILILVVLAKWPVSSEEPAYAYLGEQMDFLSELQSGNTELLNGDLAGYDFSWDDA